MRLRGLRPYNPAYNYVVESELPKPHILTWNRTPFFTCAEDGVALLDLVSRNQKALNSLSRKIIFLTPKSWLNQCLQKYIPPSTLSTSKIFNKNHKKVSQVKILILAQ